MSVYFFVSVRRLQLAANVLRPEIVAGCGRRRETPVYRDRRPRKCFRRENR